MDLQKLTARLSNHIFLDGELKSPCAAETLAVISPIDSQRIATIPLCNNEDVNVVVESSKRAQIEWAQTSNQKRASILKQCGLALKEHAEELAQLMSLETGKAISTESRLEVKSIEEIFDYYAGLALEIKGETIPFDPNVVALTMREPFGVVGAIIPWNVPLMLMAVKIAPALVTGNTVVLKASPEATLTVLRAAEIMGKILPKGVLNILTGDGPGTGASLVNHSDVAKVTFTGSVEGGIDVYKNAAAKLIPVTLELGGKSPFIIYPDADLDRAVNDAIIGMRFTRQGQSCSAASRLFLHTKIYDTFLEKMKIQLAKMKVGHPLKEETDIGSIISKKQYLKILDFIKLAKEDPNLDVCEIGKLLEDISIKDGFYILPTLITGITNTHAICQKEIFGPVVCIISWQDEEEVLKEANDTKYGLAAAVWTKDITTALRAVKRLDAGFVQINQYNMFKAGIAFGGFKSSGLGKEASKNSMIENFTREKLILINIM